MLSANLIAALRGPVLLLTLGSLLVMSNENVWNGRGSFKYTWPALIIVFGLFKLLEAVAVRDAIPPTPPPPAPLMGGPQQ